ADIGRYSPPGYDGIANLDLVRSNDVAFFAVNIMDKADISGPVGVVFNGFNLTGYSFLVPLKVDQPVSSFMSASDVADRHLTGIVAATGALTGGQQALFWCVGGNFRKSIPDSESRSWCDRFKFFQCH